MSHAGFSPEAEQRQSGVVPPHRDVNLIEHDVPHKTKPVWQDDGKAKMCSHCGDKLKRGHKHNCRLCGQVVCSACTTKLNVPEMFRKKGKTGPVRVCLGCRNLCLEHRNLHSGQQLSIRPRQQFDVEKDVILLYPPNWIPPDEVLECFQCGELYDKYHNCRLCGHAFCDECSTKTSQHVPPAFRKKGKSGATRCCWECRFLLLGGAVLQNAVRRAHPALGGRPASQSVAAADVPFTTRARPMSVAAAGATKDFATEFRRGMQRLNVSDASTEFNTLPAGGRARGMSRGLPPPRPAAFSVASGGQIPVAVQRAAAGRLRSHKEARVGEAADSSSSEDEDGMSPVNGQQRRAAGARPTSLRPGLLRPMSAPGKPSSAPPPPPAGAASPPPPPTMVAHVSAPSAGASPPPPPGSLGPRPGGAPPPPPTSSGAIPAVAGSASPPPVPRVGSSAPPPPPSSGGPPPPPPRG